MMMIIILSALFILMVAFLVFRRLVRRDYLQTGHLRGISSFSQLLVFALVMGFPYLFHPPKWSWFWRLDGPSGTTLHLTGFIIVIIGFVLAFGVMAWFGFSRAFGFGGSGIISRGPYSLTRNPQIIGGYLLVIGISVQLPSLYNLLWISLYGISGHWMILTEEEYLEKKLGKDYLEYCEQTPRYLFRFKRRK